MDIEQIKNKYKFNYKQLILHYLILGGEIPSDFITSICPSYNTWKYIANKSNYKGFFIYKRGNNHNGFQLSSKAKDEIKNLCYDYSPFLINSEEPTRLTNNIYQRVRYQMRTRLYYLLDTLSIEYMSERISGAGAAFYDVRRLKQNFAVKSKSFSRAPSREFQIQGSRAFGVIRTANQQYYLTYAFEYKLNILSFAVEERLNTFINNTFNTFSTGEIIFTRRAGNAVSLLKTIVSAANLSKPKDENPLTTKLYSYFRQKKAATISDLNYLGMHILSYDELGQKQLRLLLDNEKSKKIIIEALAKIDKGTTQENIKKYKTQYGADTVFNNLPCFFLQTLDVRTTSKLILFSTLYPEQHYYVAAFGEHIQNGLEEILRIGEKIIYKKVATPLFIDINSLDIFKS